LFNNMPIPVGDGHLTVMRGVNMEDIFHPFLWFECGPFSVGGFARGGLRRMRGEGARNLRTRGWGMELLVLGWVLYG
jgi:hypothetical protein